MSWLAIATGAALLAAPMLSSAATMVWDIDSSLSSITLNVPDQSVTLVGTTVTIQLRNANNSAWSQGRTAPVEGTLTTDYVDGVSIEFLGGQHAATGLTTGNFRPNPAAFNPANSSTANPDGQYTDTTTAPAVFAAKVRGQAGLITADAGFVSFLNVDYDIMSGALPIGGGGAFAGNALTMGVGQAMIAFDGVSALPIGQPIPDSPPTASGPILGANTSAGASVTSPDPIGDPLLRQLTIPVSVPLVLTLGDMNLDATATGSIVAFGYVIPEPATLALVALGLGGLSAVRRKES